MNLNYHDYVLCWETLPIGYHSRGSGETQRDPHTGKLTMNECHLYRKDMIVAGPSK